MVGKEYMLRGKKKVYPLDQDEGNNLKSCGLLYDRLLKNISPVDKNLKKFVPSAFFYFVIDCEVELSPIKNKQTNKDFYVTNCVWFLVCCQIV